MRLIRDGERRRAPLAGTGPQKESYRGAAACTEWGASHGLLRSHGGGGGAMTGVVEPKTTGGNATLAIRPLRTLKAFADSCLEDMESVVND
ncbi:unnamed protein product [Arctogadus glacialis]